MLASALRTDAHCFRQLEPTDPGILESREWSRLSEDLTQERVRLANRMREQLWRYYPQFRKAVDDDVAAPWALDLWRSLPTPRAGQRARAATLTRGLKQHRIRRLDAALRERLRTPAVTLTPGAAEAAATHLRLVVERLALVNRQLDHVRRQLDRIGISSSRRLRRTRPTRPPMPIRTRPTRPSCCRCSASASACSPLCFRKVVMRCGGETTEHFAVCAG